MVKKETFKEGIRCQNPKCNVEIFTLRGGKKANRLCPDCAYHERQEIIRQDKIFERENMWGY